jgi:hypothetical protein
MQQFYPGAPKADSSVRGDLAADHFMEDSFVAAMRVKAGDPERECFVENGHLLEVKLGDRVALCPLLALRFIR